MARYISSWTSGDDPEQTAVDQLAQQLHQHLIQVSADIDTVHIHGAGSSAVQEIVARLLTERLGFRQERRLSFLSVAARPDFYLPMGDGRGVLAEVERGGTTTNNHDLKDLWKTHIAGDAHHLFLVVPHSNWKADGTPRERPFRGASRRLRTFFEGAAT